MDFNKLFNYRKSECCDNCSHTVSRRSTGIAWCLFKGTPELEEICDLYAPIFKTSRILEKHCYRYFVNWEKEWFNKRLREA